MWKNTINVNMKEIIWKDLDRIGLVRGGDKWQAIVQTVMNPMGCIKCEKFLVWLSNYWLIKKNSTAWS